MILFEKYIGYSTGRIIEIECGYYENLKESSQNNNYVFRHKYHFHNGFDEDSFMLEIH